MSNIEFLIPMIRFDNEIFVETRISSAPKKIAGLLKTTLKFLYFMEGPKNLPRTRLLAAEPFLEPAEVVLTRWLYTRTNGSERKDYGAQALQAARRQRYRCEHCGHADVRVFQLDHVSGRKGPSEFSCLCANCHVLKSRGHDWSGRAAPK
jgi:hypothetical protein